MQQGDYSSAPYYQFPHLQNPNPNPNPVPSDPLPNNPYASAPPFTPNYVPSDYTPYPSSYPPSYSQNPDPTPPTAPSYPPSSSNPNLPPFNSNFESNPSYQPPPSQPYFPPYDQQQTPPNYAPPPSSIPSTPNSTASYSSLYNSAPYGHTAGSSVPPVPAYEASYDNPVKPDHGSGFFDDRYGGFNRSRSDLGSDYYGKRHDGSVSRYEGGGEEGYGDGVYAYEGGKVEPYGARGTAPKSSTWSAFDDYGRSISFPSQKETSVGGKIVKAVPKADTQEDVKGGVQKFRVKLLAESGGQSTMDVLCQIGLDGIRMLDPYTSRTLRIYPLENVTRCDRMDSSTFAFWSKSPVDIEPRRIRLQSNSYTTNTLLDTVTAATIQFKEMGGSKRPVESVKINEQPAERKKGFGDWMNLIKPANEEKDHWVPDEAVSKCTACGTDFGAFVRKHHCRNCGDIFCDKCTHGRIALTSDENAQPVRVCDRCMAEVTQRLNSAKESSSKPALQSHEDLARKLQEELERNRKLSVYKPEGSGRRMKEVACPICTVHLQVQVPSSGSETIECGVCQHPFLVSAH
ncbi:protein FREE1 isoform X1 [Abrus precatorius]|uniref:Protein FREE1 isoform X1 n=1 Tax=Abrus precatorius TaxID=3816 RepID=A0A8B8LCF9_ABRPR|nr:protein FREE1 isoform X1 [Abrus precatorius]